MQSEVVPPLPILSGPLRFSDVPANPGAMEKAAPKHEWRASRPVAWTWAAEAAQALNAQARAARRAAEALRLLPVAGSGEIPLPCPVLYTAAAREAVLRLQSWWKCQLEARALLFDGLVVELLELRAGAAEEIQRMWRKYIDRKHRRQKHVNRRCHAMAPYSHLWTAPR